MIPLPFYSLKKGTEIINYEYHANIGLQLPDGDFLKTEEPYGIDRHIVKINRETGEETALYYSANPIRLKPMEVLDDGNVIFLGFDYPYKNHRLLRSTDPSLTKIEEVLYLGHTKPYSKHGIAQSTKDGTILVGEYIGSYAWDLPDANTECKIWMSKDGGWTWEVLYAFKRNNHPDQYSDELLGNGIQHIHVVEYDEYTDSFWIGTGDSDRESSTWTWNERDGFTLIGRGYADGHGIDDGQFWRVIAYEFFEDCVLWGIDGYIEGQWIMRYDRKLKTLTKMHEKSTGEYMFYSGTSELAGGQKVAFFSGTSGTIYCTKDFRTTHVLKEFPGESSRVQYTFDKIDRKMMFVGWDTLTLDGKTLGTGSIDFEPRDIQLKFLSQD